MRSISTRSASCDQGAFTLIEILIVCAIIGIMMTIAIPSVYRSLHPESMRKAVSDVVEACSHARAMAILQGVPTAVTIRPADGVFSVGTLASSGPQIGDLGKEGAQPAQSGQIFRTQLSDTIKIEFLGINLHPDLQEMEEVAVRFFPNGTCDECAIVLRSEKNELRKITLEVVTGLADVDVIR